MKDPRVAFAEYAAPIRQQGNGQRFAILVKLNVPFLSGKVGNSEPVGGLATKNGMHIGSPDAGASERGGAYID